MKKITDHADRTTALLPKAHARTQWQMLSDGIVGRRGQWAEDDDLYAVQAGSTTPAVSAFVARDADLVTLFGSGGTATVRSGSAQLVDEGSPASEGYSLWFYRGPAVALVATAQVVKDMLDAGDLLEMPPGLGNEQVKAFVADELASADWGIQELEGEFQKLLDLRSLALAFGEQLDELGSLLGLARDGEDDETYRTLLAWKAAVNVSNGTVEDILHMATIVEEVAQIQLLETFPAHMVTYFHGGVISAGLRRLLHQMPREGIGISVTSAESLNPFVFGPDGGWFRVTDIYDNRVTLKDPPLGHYAVGDRVRFFDVLTDTFYDPWTVYEVYDGVLYDDVYDLWLDKPGFAAAPPTVSLNAHKKGLSVVSDSMTVTFKAGRRYLAVFTFSRSSIVNMNVLVTGPSGTVWGNANTIHNAARTHRMYAVHTPGVDVTGTFSWIFRVVTTPTAVDNYTVEVLEIDDGEGTNLPEHVAFGFVEGGTTVASSAVPVGDGSAVVAVASKADAGSDPTAEAGWATKHATTSPAGLPIGTVAFAQAPAIDPTAGASLGVSTSAMVMAFKFGSHHDFADNYIILEDVTRGVQDPDGHGFEDGYEIYDANPGTRRIIFLGDGTREFVVGHTVRIVGSTGNDAPYVVTLVELITAGAPPQAATRVTMQQALPSAVADGVLEHASPGYASLRGVYGGTDSKHGEMADEWNSPA